METNFNDIQQLWQSKKASDFDLPALIQQMKATEKKQKLEWMIALACTPITMIILVYVLPLKDSFLGVLTLLVIAFGMAWVIWLNSKALLRTVEDSESYSQRSFVEDQLHKLQLRGKIIQKHMITYGLLIAFAINMGYLEVLSPLSVKFRILAHLGATGMIAGVMWYTLRKKKRTFEIESKPMILQLEKLLAEMKS
jgi:1,4-dihydroxy-2-naphthoate octaprenyltransferase